MSKKNLWEKEPYFAPDCERLIINLTIGVCQSGGGSGSGFGDHPDDEIFVPDDDLIIPDIEIL